MTLAAKPVASQTDPLPTISVNELVDGTVGNPQPIASSVGNGTVACGAAGATPTPAASPMPTPPGQLPPTGGRQDSSSFGDGWVVPLAVSLAVTALGLGVVGAMRLRRRV